MLGEKWNERSMEMLWNVWTRFTSWVFPFDCENVTDESPIGKRLATHVE